MTAEPRDPGASRTKLVLEPLRGRRAWISVTAFLSIALNLLVAGAMLIAGAGLWHFS